MHVYAPCLPPGHLQYVVLLHRSHSRFYIQVFRPLRSKYFGIALIGGSNVDLGIILFRLSGLLVEFEGNPEDGETLFLESRNRPSSGINLAFENPALIAAAGNFRIIDSEDNPSGINAAINVLQNPKENIVVYDRLAHALAVYPGATAHIFEKMHRFFLLVEALDTYQYGKDNIYAPAGTLFVRGLQVYTSTTAATGANSFLEKKDISFIREYDAAETTTGTPKYYAMSGGGATGAGATTSGKITIVPTPSSGFMYKLHYNARPLGLSSANTTTYLSLNFGNGTNQG